MGDPGGPEPGGRYDLRPAGRFIRRNGRLVLGAVSLVLAMALVAFAAVGVDSLFTPGPGRSPSAATASAPAPRPSPTGPTAGQAIQRCRALWAAQGQTLGAAARAVAQWQLHVSAMNQLVAGAITPQQAQEFWAKSRIDAAERVQAFEEADRRLGRVQATCDDGGVQPAAAGTEEQLQACVRGVRDRSVAVVAAERSIATWQDHINDMELFRMGQMSAQMAGRMWSKNWHKGQRQLDSYRAVARLAAAQHC